MTVVHCKMAPYDVYIGRPGDNRKLHFGNPFANREGTKALIVVPDPMQACKDWLNKKAWRDVEPQRRDWILQQLPSLRGKTFGCWCKVRGDEDCHGDIFEELISDWLADRINGAGELEPDDDEIDWLDQMLPDIPEEKPAAEDVPLRECWQPITPEDFELLRQRAANWTINGKRLDEYPWDLDPRVSMEPSFDQRSRLLYSEPELRQLADRRERSGK